MASEAELQEEVVAELPAVAGLMRETIQARSSMAAARAVARRPVRRSSPDGICSSASENDPKGRTALASEKVPTAPRRTSERGACHPTEDFLHRSSRSLPTTRSIASVS
jgi:hypothetical protein